MIRRTARLPTCACLALGAVLALPSRAPAQGDPPAPDAPVWVDLASPAAGAQLESPVALAEVRGRAGSGDRAGLDLVVALDVSLSTLYPSGRDVDGDGVTGALRGSGPLRAGGGFRPAQHWTTDPGDTVLSAELEAARRLLRSLAADGTRVGLLTFSGRTRVRAGVGALEETLGELDRVRPRLESDGTDLGAAVRTGVHMLESVPGSGHGHGPILILLSDGEPTAPMPELFARRAALRAAERAREAGVRIFAFALGADAQGAALLAGMAELTGGDFCESSSVGEILEHLPYSRLADVDSIEMQNLTAELPGRAIRLFADGSFDGFVPLLPGPNRIEIRVRTHSGEQGRLLRDIEFAPREARGEADLAELDALNRRLELRALESELAARVREGARLRELDIRVAPAAADPAGQPSPSAGPSSPGAPLGSSRSSAEGPGGAVP